MEQHEGAGADALGEVVYVELPEVGAQLTAGQVCGEIESTKSVSELFAPVSGEVVQINEAAAADPALINSDPYGEGWLFRVAVSDEFRVIRRLSSGASFFWVPTIQSMALPSKLLSARMLSVAKCTFCAPVCVEMTALLVPLSEPPVVVCVARTWVEAFVPL